MHPSKRNPKAKVTDLWHVGIAHAPIARFLTDAPTPAITWLPLPRSFSFIADPFGVREPDGGWTVCVEALDYRVKRGEIHYYKVDAQGRVQEQGVALKAKTHLSYPFLIREGGETYMLPESYRSGKLTLYRATDYPRAWEPVATLLEMPAIDASIIAYEGRYWMFFALPGPAQRALDELHIAYADTLTGPWTLHAHNPVRKDIATARMGGTPFIHEGTLYLPMQDGTHTYGGALRILKVTRLTPEQFIAEEVRHIAPAQFGHAYADGCHTLSACGDSTLFDVKRHDTSRKRFWIDMERRLRRLG